MSDPTSIPRRLRLCAALGAALLLALSACGGNLATRASAGSDTAPAASATLRIGAIPDQDPQKLQRI